MINGSVHFANRGIVHNIRAMRRQHVLMDITNQNVVGFDKIGYQRKIPVISSFAEFIGEDAVSTTTDDTVGRLLISNSPLDVALAEKGFFQIQTKDGIKLTRDGRFMMNKEGEILTLEGDKVLSTSGFPLVLPLVPEKLDDIDIDLNGKVSVLNAKTRKLEPAGTISVVSHDGVAVLSPNVRQGYNEFSNVSMETEFMQAMEYPKIFEANSVVFGMQNDILQRSIQSLSQ